jgi:hypothetical protein
MATDSKYQVAPERDQETQSHGDAEQQDSGAPAPASATRSKDKEAPDNHDDDGNAEPPAAKKSEVPVPPKQKSPPAKSPSTSVSLYHEDSQMFHNTKYRDQGCSWYQDMYSRVGDDSRFSPGYFADVWHLLTSELKFSTLLWIYFFVEVGYILLCAIILNIVQGVAVVSVEAGAGGGVSSSGGGSGSIGNSNLPDRTVETSDVAFKYHILYALRAVTVLANWDTTGFEYLGNPLSIDPNSNIIGTLVTVSGTIVIFLQGWFHFILVCIASSLIVVRGLRPMQQVAFSHHCCVSDSELTIRVRILRSNEFVLVRPSIQVDVCMANGLFKKLPLTCEGYSKWSGNPTITMRHLVL